MKLIASLITWSMLTGTAYAGAWGDGSFENDDALDWVADCVKSATPVPVSAAIDAAVRSKYIEAPEGSAAVAAAEVVAAALGKPSSKLPSELRAWVRRQSTEQLAQLAPAARTALARILDSKVSELRQLWSEGKLNTWSQNIVELQSRLTK